MKHDEERLEQLLESRTFSQLTADEKEFVIAALGSEEEYTSMKQMDKWLAPDERSSIQPERETVALLTARMRELHQPVSIWLRFVAMRIPAYAALMLLIFTTGLAVLLRPESTERTIAGPETLKIDTVYITRRDTVFRDKIIYTTIRTPQVDGKKQIEVVPAAIPVGVSMKEKDELNKLLVSGSD